MPNSTSTNTILEYSISTSIIRGSAAPEYQTPIIIAGQIRALELQSQYWRTSSLPTLLPAITEFTPELVNAQALNFDLHLADTMMKVHLPTLMSVSPIFRTMIDWESQPGQAYPTNKHGEPVAFFSLSEDNLGRISLSSLKFWDPGICEQKSKKFG